MAYEEKYNTGKTSDQDAERDQSFKKALNTKNISSPRKNSNLLQSVDPAKINEWISILSNPAIMDLLNKFTSKPAPPEQPAVPRKRRRFLF